MATPGPRKTMTAFKHCVYEVLLTMAHKATQPGEMQIVRKYPALPWPRVWKNLRAARLPDTIASTWYAAIRGIIPTNERLAAIHLVPTVTCSLCVVPDTLQHRIPECEEGPVMWN
jgi:hypothetical protein